MLDRSFLSGGGTTGALMRAHDWSGTPLGAPEDWPQSLRTSVSTCLNCAFPILLWWGPELVMLYNDEYSRILGSKHLAALGQAGAACWPEIWEVIGPMLQQVLQRGEPTRSRDLLLTLERNGYPEECYFSFSYSPIRDESGGIGGVFTPVIETTAQVIGERRLRTVRDLASRTPSAPDVMATVQRSVAVLARNPHDIPFAAIYLAEPGHRFATLVAHAGNASSPFPTELALQDQGPLASPALAVRTVQLPIALAGQDQPSALLLAGLSPRQAFDRAYREFLDMVAGQVGTALADTMACEARAEAEAANARFSFALAAARMFAWEWDLATDFVYRSPQARELVGFESGPIDSFRALIHPADRPHVEAAWLAARFGQQEGELEYRVHVGGKEVWLAEKSRPTRSTDGALLLAGVAADITARKQAELARSESEERLRQLAENIREVFYVADPRGRRVEYVSPAYEAIWGLPAADVYADQAAFFAALHPEDRAAFRAVVASQVRIGAPTEQRYRIVRPDGSIRRIRDRAWPLRDPSGEVYRVVGLAEDETDRLAAEQRLAESEASLRQLNQTLETRVAERTADRDRTWKNAQDLLCIIDRDGHFRAANPAWTTVLGWLPEEVVGQHHLAFTHPDHLGASAAARAASALQPLPNYESRLRHKDGSYRWIAWVAATEGDLVYASGRHITAEKQAAAELARTQELLRQAQKMEALGQLTGGIAHDFNNMLQGVTSGINLARRRMEGGRPEEAGKFLDAAVDAAGRAGALVHRLLAFARRQALLPRRVDLNRLLGGMVELVRQTVGSSITVTARLSETIWPVSCDPNHFENTLLNLAINARDAMLPAGGTLLIETANVRLEADDISGWDTAAPGDHVRLSVIDSGAGMQADVLEHAFEPFFTTKPVGQGTGLGLSQVFGFVSQSKGVVRLQSQVGQGTAVHIYLPRHATQADADPAGARPATASATAGMVLLVEDETSLRQAAAEALRAVGCTVIEAKDGPTGLMALHDAAATQPAGIDILVADVGLPGGLNGRQLADSARELMPRLPVLLITGYSGEALRAAGDLAQGIEIMAKPFALEALTALVQTMLTQPRA